MAKRNRKVTIKRIGVISFGKIFGFVYGILGFIFALFLTLFVSILPTSAGMGMFKSLFGIAAIILVPIFYGILGFIFGSVFALIYNFIASKFGGLEIETR